MRFSRSAIAVLEADPDLGAGLDPIEHMRARARLIAPALDLEPGEWDPTTALDGSSEKLSLLVLDGLLIRTVVLAGCPSAELVGPGDLVELSALYDRDCLLPVEVLVTAAAVSRVALLSHRFRLAAARWPPVTAALLEREEQHSARLAKQAAICHLQTVEARLLALFMHLADRWGRVCPTHVMLPLRLLHRTLGELVGAERCTVSLALKRLARAGLVIRCPDGSWLLRPDLGSHLRSLTRRPTLPAAFVGRATAPQS
jgi:CRP/FNR family cyclic AMP-dependent transcriptional regulator